MMRDDPIAARGNPLPWQEAAIALAVSCSLSLDALAYYFRHRAILLSGDAVAHINIARRIFDSLTPSALQLGTVWLPLTHLLTVPFIVSDLAWRTGLGGSVVSVAGYVLACLGLLRLLRAHTSRISAWTGLLIFAANPNLLYLQTTALNEAPYLAAMLWSVVFYSEFRDHLRRGDFTRAGSLLQYCGLALSAAMLVRYDGWFLGIIAGCLVLYDLHRHRAFGALRRPLRNFILLGSLTAIFWLGYNWGTYGNALEFLNGPYSAKGIAERTTVPGTPHHPGDHDLRTAAIYFVKCAQLNLAEGRLEPVLFGFAVASTFLLLFLRRFSAELLLWAQLPFYVLSIAYGGVPIFMPVWWPHSYYNVRYGIELLPAVAAFCALGIDALAHSHSIDQWLARKAPARSVPMRYVLAFVLALVTLAGYLAVWRSTPVSLREIQANSVTRVQLETRLAAQLRSVPRSSRLLMYASRYVGALQLAGIPLRRVVNETNHPFWEEALQAPAQAADYVIAFDGDPVAQAVAAHGADLEIFARIDVPGQSPATIFVSRFRHPALLPRPSQ